MARLVRQTNRFPLIVRNKGNMVARVTKAWRIRSSRPLWVVDTDVYQTVIDESGEMQDCWHIGAGPTYLARLVLNRQGANA